MSVFCFLVHASAILFVFSRQNVFCQKHGHCRVPHGYPQNRKLSWWVMNQRAQYQLILQGKSSWLSQDRIRLLDMLGFDWNPIIGKSGETP
jgi:hypothetical protein